MNSKAFLLVVFSFLLNVVFSSDTIEYEEKIDALDTNNEEEDRSNESQSGEFVPSTRATFKYHWVPQVNKQKKKIYMEMSTRHPESPEVSTIALKELKKNLTYHFDNPPIHDIKFTVSIQRKGAHYATGALIDRKWVISSAREFYNVRESIKLFRLRIGTTDCKRGGILIPIKEILIHPSYKYGDISNDVALLRLAVPTEENDDIEAIQLAQFKVCNKFVTTYWPRVFVNNVLLPATYPERMKYNHIRVSTQMLMPWKECFKWMARKNVTLQESSMCLKPITVRHSKCLPDAGAPVLSGDGLWGVTSSWKSLDCNADPSPTVATRTTAPSINSWVKKWIASPLWNPGAAESS